MRYFFALVAGALLWFVVSAYLAENAPHPGAVRVKPSTAQQSGTVTQSRYGHPVYRQDAAPRRLSEN